MTSYQAKPLEAHQSRKWWLVDAKGQSLGRLASRLASVLRGKHKPTYTPHVDTGDFVIVVNAAAVKVTGKKPKEKFYHQHSSYPGGIKSFSYEALSAKKPGRPLELAVKGMLPKNVLGRQMLTKLKIYGGPTHPHVAQQPAPLAV